MAGVLRIELRTKVLETFVIPFNYTPVKVALRLHTQSPGENA